MSRNAFSSADLNRITLPETVTKTEDIVLGYCCRYWGQINDAAFENLVAEYSELHSSCHLAVFKVIKNSRIRKLPDDEMLHAVAAVLSDGYFYSMEGDRYMQSMWRNIKPTLLAAERSERDAERTRLSGLPPQEERGQKTAKPIARIASAGNASTAPRQKAPVSRKTGLKRKHAGPNAKKSESPDGGQGSQAVRSRSVSESLRLLSGTTYDVFGSLFDERAPGAIHAWLAKNGGRRKSFFDDTITKAEDIVFTFMRDNYDNPYMDWEGSKEREALAALGYSIPSLDGIVEACWQKIKKSG